MDVLEAISRRHSYRGKFHPVPVPRADLVTIMEAGLAAPSGCNMQTTSLLAIDDPEVLERLRAVITPPVCETAPAMICVLTQRINAYRDRCYAVQDYSAAIENMLLAITELGYSSCWVEGHITDDDRIGEKMALILGFSRSSTALSAHQKASCGRKYCHRCHRRDRGGNGLPSPFRPEEYGKPDLLAPHILYAS